MAIPPSWLTVLIIIYMLNAIMAAVAEGVNFFNYMEEFGWILIDFQLTSSFKIYFGFIFAVLSQKNSI